MSASEIAGETRIESEELLNLGEKLYAIRPIVRSMVWRVKPFPNPAWTGLGPEV